MTKRILVFLKENERENATPTADFLRGRPSRTGQVFCEVPDFSPDTLPLVPEPIDFAKAWEDGLFLQEFWSEMQHG